MSTRLLRRLGKALAGLLIAAPLAAAADGAVPVRVNFRLIDAQGAPLAGTALRLVMALDAGWQQPEVGLQAQTDELGEAHWNTQAQPERRRRKLPTNFFTQLASSAQDTTWLAIGAELNYLGRPWLVVASAYRFPEGSTVQLEDALQVYGRDAAGRFSLPVTRQGDGWRLPGVAGMLTTPGFRIESLRITPADDGWVVDLAIRRAAEPVVR